MSEYHLFPSSKQADIFAFWENGWSDSEISRLRTLGDSLIDNDEPNATISSGKINPTYRRTQVAWLKTNDALWVYDKLGFIIRQLNEQFFRFDIDGFYEDLQYTVYKSDYEGFYDWHCDSGVNLNVPPRKLSISVQLSDPEEYEGGSLELLYKNEPEAMKKEKGTVIVFPSYTLHRVTPITKGTRRSLVVWIYGPRLR